MKQDFHNVVMSVEIMFPTEHGARPTDAQVKAALIEAVKNGLWFNVTSPQVVHTATEEV